MINIIPLAGRGSRFKNVGGVLPKPLISVLGEPMILSAIKDMPPSDKWIFLVRKEHIEQYRIDNIIKTVVPSALIIAVDEITNGQATTCMLAEKYISDEEDVFIGACDVGSYYDKKKYYQLCKDNDAIVWTVTKKESLRRNPCQYGWCILGEDGYSIVDMSIKKPVSGNPYYDHAVIGSFYFKRFGDFKKAYHLMVQENYRINNEFYVDSLPIFLKRMNKTVAIFDVFLYSNWGTPEDLNEFQLIEHVCKYEGNPKLLFEEDQSNIQLWKEYFKSKILK